MLPDGLANRKILKLALGSLAVAGLSFGIGVLLLWTIGKLSLPSASLGLGLGSLTIITFTTFFVRVFKGALESERALNQELRADQADLEKTIEDRSQDLARRLTQIRTAAEISRTISSIRDPDPLLTQLAELIRDHFDLYYVGAFLLDDSERVAILRAGTGDAAKSMLAQGHRLLVDRTSMVGWAITERRARIALDVGEEAIRFNNPHLPLTRSELAMPLLVGDNVLGALTIQSDQAGAFDQDDITVLQGISDSLATALENARLYQQAQANLEEIRSLHRSYLAEAWTQLVDSRKEIRYTYENEQIPASQSHAGKVTNFPMLLRDQVIGELTLETDNPEFADDEIAFISGILDQAALSLENARLLEEAQRLAFREQKIGAISNRIRGSIDLDTILHNTVRELGLALGSSNAFIQIGLEDAGETGETQE
jgi:GAF domain-containing protein